MCIVFCLELTTMWRGNTTAHTGRELTTVFTTQRLHFQMTADNCFTWPWPLRPAGRDLTCQVRTSYVNDGELQRSLFGELENDSTCINQGDMRPAFLPDKKVQGPDPLCPDLRRSFAWTACGSPGHIKGYEEAWKTEARSIGFRNSS